jgi:prepilin-type N-terminal cleavage/methylation domain-containing protein
MKKRNKNQGFTLIELLVVISIVGLLSTTILVSLGSARTKARDARRTEDLHQLRNAFDIYYAKNGYYPTPARLNVVASPCSSSDYWPALMTELGINPITPPNGGADYCAIAVNKGEQIFVGSNVSCVIWGWGFTGPKLILREGYYLAAPLDDPQSSISANDGGISDSVYEIIDGEHSVSNFPAC